MTRDHYEVLGVAKTATKAEIKTAYRRAARKFHPDKNPNDAGAAQRFREAKEAYEVLRDDSKRKLYDIHGSAGAGRTGPGPSDAGFVDLSDMFGDFFGGMFGGGRGQTAGQRGAGRDMGVVLDIDLEEAVFGTEREIIIDTLAVCGDCVGSGAADGMVNNCTVCQGRGQVRSQRGMFAVFHPCAACGGQGKTIPHPCATCSGEGRTPEQRHVSVRIPAGVETGDRLRMTGLGIAGTSGQPAGDLYVEFFVRSHAVFRRDGYDLHRDVPIGFAAAALGGKITVSLLGGQEALLTVAPGTQTHTLFRVRGQGVFGGDLICRVVVVTPVGLTDEQKDLLRLLDEQQQGDGADPAQSSAWDGVKSFWSRMTG